MKLTEYQAYLHAHFQSLAKERAGLGLPVFALEHGLDESGRDGLTKAIRGASASAIRDSDFWLVWVVYAAEEGYGYLGEEYWTTFAADLPHWYSFSDRQRIRDWYKKFAREYGAAKPSGDWAARKSIIAWPITHAVVPRDLQLQLAKTLFGARYSLRGACALDPLGIGQIVAVEARHGHVTSRFLQFVQQHSLVGHIVASLLAPDDRQGDRLERHALRRITEDLERTRNGREWLRDARKAYDTPRINFGRAFGQRPAENEAQLDQGFESLAKGDQAVPPPSIRLLRQAKDIWACVVTLPSLSLLAKGDARVSEILNSSRVRVKNSTASWKSRGWLIYGPHEQTVSEWPTPGSLIEIETQSQDLTSFCNEVLSVNQGALWLFRVRRDGFAGEVKSLAVRPNCEYIVVSRQPIACSLLRPIALSCIGASAAALKVPEKISPEIETALKSIGLKTERIIKITPIGLVPHAWDGEGRGEWLATEEPTFLISSDHPVSHYMVVLDQDPGVRLVPINGRSMFRTGRLRDGKHQIRVTAQRPENSDGRSQVTSTMEVVVRPPAKWPPGRPFNRSILVNIAPLEPTIDDFLDNQIDLDLAGPSSETVEIAVELTSHDGNSRQRFPMGSHRLPITDAHWRSAVTDYLQLRPDASPFFAARSAEILISASLLGEYSIHLHQRIKPLRWMYARQSAPSKPVVRIVDDSADHGALEMLRYTFGAPITAVSITQHDDGGNIEIPQPGGLFFASNEAERDCLVVSNPKLGLSLKDLATGVDAADIASCGDVTLLLDALDRWGSARGVGPLVASFSNRVRKQLHQRALAILAGERFWRTLNSAQDKVDESRWDKPAGLVEPANNGFGIALTRRDRWVGKADSQMMEEFFQSAKRYQIASSKTLCEAAFDLIKTPNELIAKGGVAGILANLARAPAILRGMLVVCAMREATVATPAMESKQ